MKKEIKCCNNLCPKRKHCTRAELGDTNQNLIEPYQWFDKDTNNCFLKREGIKYKLEEEKSPVEINRENYLADKDALFEKVLENAQYRIQYELSVSRIYYFRLHVNKVADFSEQYVYDYCDRKRKHISDILQTNIG